MADQEKTQKPTPKRIKEFRKRGEIALSRDLVSAAAFGGGAIALIVYGASGFEALRALTRDAAVAADGGAHTEIAGAAVHAFTTAALPVALGAGLASIGAIASQLGWPPALKGISIDFTRMNPASNLMNTFGLGTMAKRTGTSLAKLAVVAVIVVSALGTAISARPNSAVAFAHTAGLIVTRILEVVIGALLAIAAVDYILARRKINASMKMSTEEIKREFKESDGDPQVKGKRKQRAKEMARRRLAAAIKTADVIVVNPTHYAVALRYNDKTDAAPIVVAKGVDEAAEKIRELGRQHGVPILPRPPLARALHKLVKEGRPVPSNLYKAVAEVLAFVYRIKNRGNS